MDSGRLVIRRGGEKITSQTAGESRGHDRSNCRPIIGNHWPQSRWVWPSGCERPQQVAPARRSLPAPAGRANTAAGERRGRRRRGRSNQQVRLASDKLICAQFNCVWSTFFPRRLNRSLLSARSLTAPHGHLLDTGRSLRG